MSFEHDLWFHSFSPSIIVIIERLLALHDWSQQWKSSFITKDQTGFSAYYSKSTCILIYDMKKSCIYESKWNKDGDQMKKKKHLSTVKKLINLII